MKNKRNETPIATIEGIIKKKIGKVLLIMSSETTTYAQQSVSQLRRPR